MLPYYLLLLLPLLVYGALAIIFKNKLLARKYSLVCFFTVLFVVLAWRNETVGIDIKGYKYYFEKIAAADWGDLKTVADLEFGYILLNKIVSLFTSNFHVFLTVVALITVFPVALLYLKNDKHPEISIILFINMSTFSLMFSGLRQAIAISLGMLAYYFLSQKKGAFAIIPSALLILLAMTLHNSAFILLFMYPLYYIRIPTKWLIGIVPAYILVLIFNKQILSLLMHLLPDKYAAYSIEPTGAYTMILLFAAFLIYCYVVPGKNELDRNTTAMRNFLMFALAIQLFAPVSTMAMRFNYYYIMFLPLLIPKIIDRCSEKIKFWVQLSHIGIVLFFTAYFFYGAYAGADVLHIFPYEPCWN